MHEWCAECRTQTFNLSRKRHPGCGFLADQNSPRALGHRAISVPEDDSSARFATICVRAAKIYRASSPLSSATTTKPLDSQQPEREAPPDAAAFLHGQRVHEEAIVATVDIDLQQLAFEGGAVSADSECVCTLRVPVHVPCADQGRLLRQRPCQRALY